MVACRELFLHSNFAYEKVICLISVMFSVSGGKLRQEIKDMLCMYLN